MSLIRLDKFLADAGFGTRTQVKALIRKGQAAVNGLPAGRPEQKVDPEKDAVTVCGQAVTRQEHVCYMFNKPAGCLCEARNGHRKTVFDYFEDSGRRALFTVGRLDRDTEGLLLVTDDGALGHHLTSPRRHVDKTYYAELDGPVGEDAVRRFKEGLDIGDDKPALPAVLVPLPDAESARARCCPDEAGFAAPQAAAAVLITVQEGRYHEVKRLFQAVGRKVLYLKRISEGSLKLDASLAPGTYRLLTPEELKDIYRDM